VSITIGGLACRVAVLALGAASAAPGQVRILGYGWENPLPYQSLPQGLTSLRAAQCGACHQEIYQEWQVSTHAQALSDKQFQAEMAKSPATGWLCLNCHTPLENQMAAIAVGVRGLSTHQPILKKNPRFDRTLSAEGITCAVCHVRDGVVLGPRGDSQAPHPVRKEPRLLDERNCASCHQAVAAYTDTLVCNLETAQEWRKSPQAARGQACSHCHMPEVRRSVAVGGPVRTSRRHLFLGSKIPKEKAEPDSYRGYYALYSSGLSVVIQPDQAGDPRRPTLPAKLLLKNARAGHWLPTGDPERFILIKAALIDPAGHEIDQKLHRIGQEWVWHPQARKLSDNRLKPLEERTVEILFQNPRHLEARLVRVVVENWRMNAETAAYHKLTGVYPLSAVVQRLEKRWPRAAPPAPGF